MYTLFSTQSCLPHNLPVTRLSNSWISMANSCRFFKTSIHDPSLKFSPTSAETVRCSGLFHSWPWNPLTLVAAVVGSMLNQPDSGQFWLLSLEWAPCSLFLSLGSTAQFTDWPQALLAGVPTTFSGFFSFFMLAWFAGSRGQDYRRVAWLLARSCQGPTSAGLLSVGLHQGRR